MTCLVYVSRRFLSLVICFFKQKTAYEMRISDWSSDVCSSDLSWPRLPLSVNYPVLPHLGRGPAVVLSPRMSAEDGRRRSYGLRVINSRGRGAERCFRKRAT